MMSYEQSRIAINVERSFMRAGAEKIDVPPDFQGDPEEHGIEEPRGGGFSIMQNLQKDLHEESYEESGVTPPKTGSRLFSASVRQAMYWCGPERTYRLTKGEQNDGNAICPKCKGQMEKEPFTRSEKMWRCPECGFKVPTGKAINKIEIEIEPDGEIEVELTTAGLKPRRVR